MLRRDDFTELFETALRGRIAAAFAHADLTPGEAHWKMIRGEAEITLRDIYASIIPFVLVMVAALVIIMIFPEIALWLPEYVYDK